MISRKLLVERLASRSRPTLCRTSGCVTSMTAMAFTRSARAARRPWRGAGARLVQADAARHRDVEALDRAPHRQVHQLVAGARRQLAHAAAFGAEDDRERAAQVELVERARRRLGRADDADVALLQLAERARQVGDHEVRHRLGGAARDLGDRRVDADRVVLRRDHRVRAGAVGDAQAGAEVVRIGDAVEHEDERRLAGRFGSLERVVERMAARDRLDARDDALVAVVAGQASQAPVVALDQPQRRPPRRARRTGACAGRGATRSKWTSTTERGAVFSRTPIA